MNVNCEQDVILIPSHMEIHRKKEVFIPFEILDIFAIKFTKFKLNLSTDQQVIFQFKKISLNLLAKVLNLYTYICLPNIHEMKP